MKLWQKIYIIFFVAFLLTFNIAGIGIIEKIHNKTINDEIERGLSRQKSILYILDISFSKDKIVKYENDIDLFIKEFADQYLTQFSEENIYVEILDKNNNIVFTNFKFTVSDREELKNLVLNKRKYIIRNINEQSYLFVTSKMNLNYPNYKVSYVRDISHIYEERKNLYKFFFQFEANVCIIFGAIIYIISKIMTRPISQLIQYTQRIAKGNYHERVSITSKDELGVLSNDFNSMAGAVEEKINELQRKNEEKQRFIDHLTHELKTPLTSIIGYANLLRTAKVSEEVFYDAVDFIYKEGKRLEQLSFKMMDLIFLNVDDFTLKHEKIMEIFKEVEASLWNKLKEKNIHLRIDGENHEVLVEKDLLKILLLNLIDNAIKASEKNDEIYLGVFESENKMVIEVKDHGIGIEQEHLDKIMEPFYMVDKSRSRKNNGAGLGLSICKKIVDIHHADMKIESKPNEGTSIKIIFQ